MLEGYILRKHQPNFLMSRSPVPAATHSEEGIALNRTALHILFHLKKILNGFIELDCISEPQHFESRMLW